MSIAFHQSYKKSKIRKDQDTKKRFRETRGSYATGVTTFTKVTLELQDRENKFWKKITVQKDIRTEAEIQNCWDKKNKIEQKNKFKMFRRLNLSFEIRDTARNSNRDALSVRKIHY